MIVGAAFNNIISSLVKDIINPILGALIGKPDFTNLFWVMKMPADYTGPMTYDALTKAGANVLGYGAFLTAVINFLLLAFVIFCMLKALSSMRRKLELEAEKPLLRLPKYRSLKRNFGGTQEEIILYTQTPAK